MTTETTHSEDQNVEWRPTQTITLPPIVQWPPKPLTITKWIFGFPGYLWPMNAFWLLLTVISWAYLTPELSAMQNLELWWVSLLFVKNLVLVVVLYGGLHLHFYVIKRQGSERRFSSKPFAINNARFLFKNQVHDNIFRTLSTGVPIITVYEVVTYWLFSNGYVGFIPLDTGTTVFWVWFGLLVLITPVIHSLHFYVTHRLLHWKLLYRYVHRIHHSNIDVGPWSGLAMHPVEQAIFFSTVCIQWLLALHPVNALFQLFYATYLPPLSHSGFEKLLVNGADSGFDGGSYFHYLHHKYFECNYGGSIAPMDQVFGTFHDGSQQAQEAIRERMRLRH